MKKVFNRILAIDGSYLLNRALKVPEIFELRGPNGQRSGGVFQFMSSLVHELKVNGDYFPVVCWDSNLSPRRVKLDSNYKHADERSKEKPVLTETESDMDYVTQYRKQRAMVIELLDYAGVPSLIYRDYEGDDLLYILSNISDYCCVVTDDKDMLQLLSPTTVVRRPRFKETCVLSEFLERENLDNIYEFVMRKAILGDPSDNIPSCAKGVGKASVHSLIEVLKFCDFDRSYFSSESTLKDFCSKYNLPYKKAFTNFDFDRYQINIGLVDLNLVEVDEYVVESIVSSIYNCRSTVDYFGFVSNLNHMGIEKISADEVIEAVSGKRVYLER